MRRLAASLGIEPQMTRRLAAGGAYGQHVRSPRNRQARAATIGAVGRRSTAGADRVRLWCEATPGALARWGNIAEAADRADASEADHSPARFGSVWGCCGAEVGWVAGNRVRRHQFCLSAISRGTAASPLFPGCLQAPGHDPAARHGRRRGTRGLGERPRPDLVRPAATARPAATSSRRSAGTPLTW